MGIKIACTRKNGSDSGELGIWRGMIKMFGEVTSVDEIRDCVSSIELDDIRDKKVCYRCVASGAEAEDCLYDSSEEMISPQTEDGICLHCYVCERDDGFERIPEGMRGLVFETVAEFERLVGEKLGNMAGYD